ncbi:hypothetical protein CSUB01_11802 [Colletotrichum sublineola]|uniref:Uncharacterized protein n=1 Tax=Colletotrichum sublineola TaxID=1173701 RepID=A0A066X7L9_COLSU|nr:hypothetical protein CSUB01_11802 [Colletotrichum sublineola]
MGPMCQPLLDEDAGYDDRRSSPWIRSGLSPQDRSPTLLGVDPATATQRDDVASCVKCVHSASFLCLRPIVLPRDDLLTDHLLPP